MNMTGSELRAYSHELFDQKKNEIFNKLKNGDTEQSFQIGGGSFTEKEWNKMVDSFDKNIDAIKEEQEQKKEEAEANRLKEQSVQEIFNKMKADNKEVIL